MASGILAQVGTVCGAALWTVLLCLHWHPIYVCRCSLEPKWLLPPSSVAPQEPTGPPGPKPSSVIQASGDTRGPV